MPDQRSVMKEYRLLDRKRQSEGLSSKEESRYAQLRELIGPEMGAGGIKAGFDVNAAAARLRDSLLPAGLRNRPPPPPARSPEPEPEPELPPEEAGAGLEAPYAESSFAPLDGGGEAQDAGPGLFDPASLGDDAAQAWDPPGAGYDPNAAGLDPNAAYDPNAAGLDPNAAYDPNAAGLDPNAAYHPNAAQGWHPDAPAADGAWNPDAAALDPNAGYDPNAAQPWDPNAPADGRWDPGAAGYDPSAVADAGAQGWDPNAVGGAWGAEAAVEPGGEAGFDPGAAGEWDPGAAGWSADGTPAPMAPETADGAWDPASLGDALAPVEGGDPSLEPSAVGESEPAAPFAEVGGGAPGGWDPSPASTPAEPGFPLGEYDALPDGAPADPAALEAILPFDPGEAAAIDAGSLPEGYELAGDPSIPAPSGLGDYDDTAGFAGAGAAPGAEFETADAFPATQGAEWHPEAAVEQGFALESDGSFQGAGAPAWHGGSDAAAGAPVAEELLEELPTIDGAEILEEIPPDAEEVPALDLDAAAVPAAEIHAPPPEEPAPPPEPPEPPPPPAASPSRIAGQHRVVVHTVEGQVKRGVLQDAELDAVVLGLASQPGADPEIVQTDKVKAIFFMLAPGEPPPPTEGKRVRVTFRDGRQIAGFSPRYTDAGAGFFMIPADTKTNTGRIWVYRSAVKSVAVS
jgi:hypothetical protein